MEYELIGPDGKTHDRFEDHDEVLDAICTEEDARPGATAGWVVQLYDEDGNEVGEPERAEDLRQTGASGCEPEPLPQKPRPQKPPPRNTRPENT